MNSVLIILAPQREHSVAYLHGIAPALSKQHPQPEMIVHTDQAGIARPGSFNQFGDAGHDAIAARMLQRAISNIGVPGVPGAIFEKSRVHRLAKHMFCRAGGSMLGAVLPGQIQGLV